MLKWAIVLLVVAIILAILGFGGFLVGALVDIAQVLFWVFIVLFVLALVFGRRIA